MNQPGHNATSKEELLLSAMLIGIALQGLNVLGTSALGILPLCWIGTILILLGFAIFKIRLWRNSAPSLWKELSAAWFAPWPWLIGLLLMAQIVAYPPTMADSLCYRLPRLFLALQEGGIGRFPTPDTRMTGMPWGWEFLALPFASLNALNASKLINLACWAVLYQLLFSFLRQRDTPPSRARWIALALAAAPVFLLQASSTANDLYAATLLLVGVWMIHRFAKAPGPVPVLASLLALVLASNAKPQFLVLGLPWLLWWAFAPGKPWKQTRWWILAIAAPLYLLVSPIPILIGNLHLTGNLLGSDLDRALTSKPPVIIMVVAGTIQFLSAQFQLPIFPGAETFSSFLRGLPGFGSMHESVPKFGPGVKMLIIVDGASLGLVHFLLLLGGLTVCIRNRAAITWPWFAAFIFGIIVSTSQFVPSTIGRSFIGFFSLLLPLAAIGLARLRKPALIHTACLLAIGTGLAAMVLNPSSPLWPARTLQSFAEKKEIHSLSSQVESYLAYQQRAQTGAGILDPAPFGETVAVLIRPVTPISPLWPPDWRAHRIEYVNHLEPEEFSETQIRWLLVADNAEDYLPENTSRYANLPGWSQVHQISYLPNLKQGHETWTLYPRSK